MNTLKEKKGNKSLTETNLHLKETEEQIYNVIQDLDVLPPGFNRWLFKRIKYFLLFLIIGCEVLFALGIAGILPASLKTVEYRAELE